MRCRQRNTNVIYSVLAICSGSSACPAGAGAGAGASVTTSLSQIVWNDWSGIIIHVSPAASSKDMFIDETKLQTPSLQHKGTDRGNASSAGQADNEPLVLHGSEADDSRPESSHARGMVTLGSNP